MHPRPDNGENSYRGSGRLAGWGALITGGDSEIGCSAFAAPAASRQPGGFDVQQFHELPPVQGGDVFEEVGVA